MNGLFFFILYMLLMVPTYVVRMAMFGTQGDEHQISQYVLIVFYGVMTLVCYWRGLSNGYGKILVLCPIVGVIFDLLIVSIHFVPSIMNVLALIIGIVKKPSMVEPDL